MEQNTATNSAPVSAMQYATPAATTEAYDKPNIFICGPSGSGKSTPLLISEVRVVGQCRAA